jgi:hypothetical protein
MPESTPHVAEPSALRVSPRYLALVLFLLLALATPVAAQQGHSPHQGGEPAATPSASYDEDWIMAAIQPELRETIQQHMPENLPIYDIDVTLEPQAEAGSVPSITGHLTLTWVNITGESLDTLPFRLFANGPDEDHDAQVVSNITVDGNDIEAELSVSDSVLEIPFEQALEPGESTLIEMDFAAFLPIDSTDHYGIFGYNSDSGTWALAHWYPVVAGRDPSTGWMLDHPSVNGDPIFTDTALYDVTVVSGPDWRLATTGVEFGDAETRSNSDIARRFVSGPARDFTIVADEDFELATQTSAGGVTVNSWYNPGEEEAGEAIAEYTVQALDIFSDLIRPYPFVELDILPVEMSGAAGCEFSQLVYMGADYYQSNFNTSVPNSADYTVAHEVVHQWFYGLVGNNQYAHAFIDEGVTNYLSAQVYFEEQYGEDVATEVMDRYIRSPYEIIIERGADQVVDQPTDDFDPSNAYVFAAYAKAPLGFEAIHQEIGDDAFFSALSSYVDQFVFRVAEPDDLREAFETASDQDLQDLWNEWFRETTGD